MTEAASSPPSVDRATIVEAIEASWSRETCGNPDDWTADNPALGHCDVSSFVAWEHLGGKLVLGQVFVDGDFQEHHYWNRFDDTDLDLTRSQFTGRETIEEKAVHTAQFLADNRAAMNPELQARIARFRERVEGHLAAR